MRLLIACRAIDNMAGGVERQAIALCNEMTSRGHDVSLLTFDKVDAKAFYSIASKVKWYKLGIGNPKHKANLAIRFKRMSKVRKIMSQFNPDIILAFQQGMFLTLRLYTINLNIPIIAAERESPFRYDFIKEGKYKNFIFQTFRLASKITIQCESYVNNYPEYLKSKITVIPNSVFPSNNFCDPIGESQQKKILLCVGRLSYAKNQIVLLEAFFKIYKYIPDWELVLAGEGEDRQLILKKIKELNIEKSVRVLGAVKNIYELYKSANILCIPSRWEGFPNALAEALAHGLPAVGYRGCGGVRDLITHQKNGFLAEGNGDISSLADSLKALMLDPQIRERMSKNAIESIKPYSPDKIYSTWEIFLKGNCLS